jgi:hypothetical protein
MDDEAPAEGGFLDPYGIHERRWISQGRPSNLVRDGNTEAPDPPQNRPAPEPFKRIPSDPDDVGWGQTWRGPMTPITKPSPALVSTATSQWTMAS